MAIVSLEGEFLAVNQRFCQVLGFLESELIGLKVRDFTHPADRPLSINIVERSMTEQPRVTRVIKRYLHRDGHAVWALLTTELRFPLDADPYFFSRVDEVDEQLESDPVVKALAHRVQTIPEHERQKIARELHDELGQIFTALKLEVHLLEQGLTPEQVKSTARILDLVSDSTRCLRQLTRSLHPPILDDIGLESALEALLKENCERAGLSWNLVHPHTPLDLDWEKRIALYRICQEAVNNVLRHAGATTVEVALEDQDGYVQLSVQDDGAGLGPDPPIGFGLMGMRERATLLGGEFVICTDGEGGTEIRVKVPVTRLADRRRLPREHWE